MYKCVFESYEYIQLTWPINKASRQFHGILYGCRHLCSPQTPKKTFFLYTFCFVSWFYSHIKRKWNGIVDVVGKKKETNNRFPSDNTT